MGGNTVEPTELEFSIALKGVWLQAKAHGVEITWEVRDFLLFEAENNARHQAWMRFYNNIVTDGL